MNNRLSLCYMLAIVTVSIFANSLALSCCYYYTVGELYSDPDADQAQIYTPNEDDVFLCGSKVNLTCSEGSDKDIRVHWEFSPDESPVDDQMNPPEWEVDNGRFLGNDSIGTSVYWLPGFPGTAKITLLSEDLGSFEPDSDDCDAIPTPSQEIEIGNSSSKDVPGPIEVDSRVVNCIVPELDTIIYGINGAGAKLPFCMDMDGDWQPVGTLGDPEYVGDNSDSALDPRHYPVCWLTESNATARVKLWYADPLSQDAEIVLIGNNSGDNWQLGDWESSQTTLSTDWTTVILTESTEDIKEEPVIQDYTTYWSYYCPEGEGSLSSRRFAILNNQANKFYVAKADLDVDSNNDGEIDDDDDLIEDDPFTSGVIVTINSDDDDGDGLIDYADFDNPNETSFVKLNLSLAELPISPRTQIKITYDASDPVTELGQAPKYILDEDNIRIWLKSGEDTRDPVAANDSKSPGDFVAPGEYTADLLGITEGNKEITLFIEGVNYSGIAGDTRIEIEVDSDGDGNYETTLVDAVRATVGGKVIIVVTDITGWDGASFLSNCRIPSNIQPSGIVCDGLNNVSDGARLLVRVIANTDGVDPDYLDNLSFDYGYMPVGQDWEPMFFAELPATEYEGKYLDVVSGSALETELQNTLGLNCSGAYELYSNYEVLDAKVYEPPVEFNMDNHWDNFYLGEKRYRPIFLSVQQKNADDVVEREIKKQIYLTRPPVMCVHGINYTYEEFYNSHPISLADTWVDELFSKGFVCEGVDHGAREYHYGNEDVRIIYTILRDRIAEVLNQYRIYRPGDEHYNHARFAVQKADVVGHSYGGVIARWYIEETPEYPDRRDVRKLITLGTPHRGAIITNIMCETYRNKTFYNAKAKGDIANLINGDDSLGEILYAMNEDATFLGIFGLRDVRWFREGEFSLPPSDDDSHQMEIVPALQVLSYNSDLILRLNESYPLSDDVAYAAVVGKKEDIKLLINSHYTYEPVCRSDAKDKSYFPWLSEWDGGNEESDAIVPIWSQRLNDSNNDCIVDENHIGYANNNSVQNQVMIWLNDHNLKLGNALNQNYNTSDPMKPSRDNAYKGATLDSMGNLYGAGVVRDAIRQTILTCDTSTPEPEDDQIDLELDSRGGIVKVNCTGMINNNNFTLSIVEDDDTLQTGISNPDSGTSGSDVWVPFNIMTDGTNPVYGTLGMDRYGIIEGPAGDSGIVSGKFGIAYEVYVSGETNPQSPNSYLKTSNPVVSKLPFIDGSSSVAPSPGTDFDVEGGYETTVQAGNNQNIIITIFDSDVGFDDPLVELSKTVSVPSDVFTTGLIMPYGPFVFQLYKNASGDVAGDNGSSGEDEAEVYQKLTQPNSTYEVESDTTSISVQQ